MFNFTPLFRGYFRQKGANLLAAHDRIEEVQRKQLSWLLEHGEKTDFGRRHGLRSSMTPQEFAAAVPLQEYPDVRADVMRMVNGESDVLWPGKTTRYAQSSGTTDGKSKYIPVTEDSLRHNHYKGGYYSAGFYLSQNPQSRLFSGKTFILGGSFANEVSDLPSDVKVGDLSAHLIDCINPLVEKMRVPGREVALMEDWTRKLEKLIEASADEDVTSISGVPSWFLTVLRGVLAKKGVASIHDVWPNLEVFFHGGINFTPYRSQYEAICDMSKMHFVETYNASEGFFAVQPSPDSPGMALLIDDGIYYEFIPVDSVYDDQPATLSAWQLSEGEVYEIVITSCNGLWRYRPGDTVRVMSLNPLCITVEGRTKQFINAFGEELMVHNAEEALSRASEECGVGVINFTAAPVYATESAKGCHQWLIQFDAQDVDTKKFGESLDRHLQAVNSDYQAKRSGNLFLAPPIITVAPDHLFNSWLAATGKLGGQRKVPRLSPNREIIDSMLRLAK